MRIRLVLLMAASLSACLSAVSLQGQTMGAAVPPGSYVNSCSQITFNTQTQELRANCQEPSQGVSTFDRIMGAGPAFTAVDPSRLIVSYCQPGSDIENLDGQLQCQATTGTWGY